jgi:hypothetical protein
MRRTIPIGAVRRSSPAIEALAPHRTLLADWRRLTPAILDLAVLLLDHGGSIRFGRGLNRHRNRRVRAGNHGRRRRHIWTWRLHDLRRRLRRDFDRYLCRRSLINRRLGFNFDLGWLSPWRATRLRLFDVLNRFVDDVSAGFLGHDSPFTFAPSRRMRP